MKKKEIIHSFGIDDKGFVCTKLKGDNFPKIKHSFKWKKI
jgi:hypothetical protein